MLDLEEMTRNIVADFLETTPLKLKLCVGDIVVKTFFIDYEGDEIVLIPETEKQGL